MRRQRFAVPVRGPHVQVLARLISGPVAGQVGGHLVQARLDGGGEPAVPVDHQVAAVVAGGDPQRDQDAVGLDRGHEPGAEVQVPSHVPGVRGQQRDGDHRPGADGIAFSGTSLAAWLPAGRGGGTAGRLMIGRGRVAGPGRLIVSWIAGVAGGDVGEG